MSSDNFGHNGRMLALALLLSVFSAGVLSALALDRLLDRDARPRAEMQRRGGAGDFGRSGQPGRGRGSPGRLGLSPLMLDRLALSDSQRTLVMDVLERRRQSSDALLDELRPRLRAQLDSARAEVRAALTPEQQTEFDRLLREDRGQFLRRQPNGNH
jgi:Spy/CpxP family protein refolding chaperone